MPPVVGTAIEHYRLLERLGQGGMGEVYLVEDTRLQRRAALKLISPSLTRDEDRRQRFVQEARLAASIDHPHIAAIYDVGEFDGRTFIVMEYVAGRSLRDLLRGGPIKLRQALDYAIEAGDALAKVHGRGVIHRDLKPENLLIANDGYLKVIDFGLAKLTGPLLQDGSDDAPTMADGRVRTADGVVMGTMGYMSPEQVRGETVDARSDIFSFGAVLFEMVTGTAPFRRRSAADTISAVLSEMPPAPRVEHVAAGTELPRIVRKCLAKDPGSRYQGMRDLMVDLRELRDAVTGSESLPHQVAPQPRPAWLRRPILAVAGCLVVLVAAIVVWGLTRQRTPGDPTAAAHPARPAVAVLPFEVLGGNQDAAWLGRGLPTMLMTGLAQTPDIELVGSERLSDAARQLGATSLETVDRSRLPDLARRAGARYVLNGTIVQSGGDIRIDARVEDLVSGGVRVAETVRGSNALTIADDLAARVRRGLDLHAAEGAVRRVADVSTSSVEAYRAYISGLEATANIRFDDAHRLFREATQIDPAFGLAYFHLATVSDYQGRITESEEWLRQAAGHVDRMSERDALLVRAQLASANGRLEESTRLLEDLVERYPESEIGWIQLGFPYFAVDPERSREVFERATAAQPQSPGLLNLLGYAQLATNRVDTALRSFEGYVKLRPSEGNALDSLAEGYLVAGRPADAVSTFNEAVEHGYAAGRSGAAFARAVLGRYDEALSDRQVGASERAVLLSRVGRYREAEQALTTLRSQYESNGWKEGIVSV
jgi:eukaryotic-like serine/threonine-protein kinase